MKVGASSYGKSTSKAYTLSTNLVESRVSAGSVASRTECVTRREPWNRLVQAGGTFFGLSAHAAGLFQRRSPKSTGLAASA